MCLQHKRIILSWIGWVFYLNWESGVFMSSKDDDWGFGKSWRKGVKHSRIQFLTQSDMHVNTLCVTCHAQFFEGVTCDTQFLKWWTALDTILKSWSVTHNIWRCDLPPTIFEGVSYHPQFWKWCPVTHTFWRRDLSRTIFEGVTCHAQFLKAWPVTHNCWSGGLPRTIFGSRDLSRTILEVVVSTQHKFQGVRCHGMTQKRQIHLNFK